MIEKVLDNLKNGLYAVSLNLFQNVIFLFYTISYDINHLIFLLSNYIYKNSDPIAAVAAVSLVGLETYYAAATITAMTIPTIILTAAPISILVWYTIIYTSYITKEYYKKNQENKYVININPGKLSKYPSYFTAAIAAVIALAVTLLITLPPFISLMLPATAFLLEVAVPIFSTISAWIFNILNAITSTKPSSAEYSSSAAAEGDATAILIFIAVILVLFLTATILSVLAKTIVYFGPAYLAFCLISFAGIGFVAASMLNNSIMAIEQNNRHSTISKTTIYYFIPQLGMLARAIITTNLGLLALDLIKANLMTLISAYATYILMPIGAIAFAITMTSNNNERLIATGAAIFYSAVTCYKARLDSVVFIIAPQLINIILAIGLAIIGAEVLCFIGSTAVDKAFKTDRVNNENGINPVGQTPINYEHDITTVATKCELTAEAMRPSSWAYTRNLPTATKVPEAASYTAEDPANINSLLMAMPTIIALEEYGATPCGQPDPLSHSNQNYLHP